MVVSGRSMDGLMALASSDQPIIALATKPKPKVMLLSELARLMAETDRQTILAAVERLANELGRAMHWRSRRRTDAHRHRNAARYDDVLHRHWIGVGRWRFIGTVVGGDVVVAVRGGVVRTGGSADRVVGAGVAKSSVITGGRTAGSYG